MTKSFKFFVFSILALTFIQSIFAQKSKFADQKTPEKVIEFFYREYFKRTDPVELPFSKSFLEQVANYNKKCNTKSESCPWEFSPLFKNEVDSSLKYKDIKAKYSKDGNDVHMTFLPNGDYGNESVRLEIIFVMIKENNKWVVDDVLEMRNGAITTTSKEQTTIPK
ncbi:MAG: hypothetical protein SFU98_11410 [Leptospiraceae bacterium]|nr:hypothetical protein [Leptospiraceae bacterium]